jgi:catechol 2,3-dioxygenase-like lactoylglutathione lyase family enzyme
MRRAGGVAATRDVAESVRFYRHVFDAPYTEDIASFQFGTWGTDAFFLLTIDNRHDDATPSSFGMLVPDVDEAHRKAIEAGRARWRRRRTTRGNRAARSSTTRVATASSSPRPDRSCISPASPLRHFPSLGIKFAY